MNFVKYKYGEVLFQGKPVRLMSGRNTAKIFSYLSLDDKHFSDYTVAQMILMGRTSAMRGFLPDNDDKINASCIIDMLGLSDISKIKYSKLNRFNKCLVRFGTSIAQNSDVIIADGIMDGFSAYCHKDIWRVLNILSSLGKTLILFEQEPCQIPDCGARVYVMDNGEITAKGIKYFDN